MNRTRISVVVACLAAASPAYAHFNLMAPTNWTTLTADGTPQKMAPCGNEGTPADNGSLTEYKEGATISITVAETVFHPGHYRVSLAADQASLPVDPSKDVVPDMQSQCGSLAIKANPAMPLIGDGLLVHTARFAGPQTMQVTLPSGMTCDHCVLQVVEFMANHGAPCFYHHCANVKISANGPVGGVDAGPTGPDAGPIVGGGPDAGISGDAGTTGGSSGGCSVASKDATGVALLALTVGLVLSRRRRARSAS